MERKMYSKTMKRGSVFAIVMLLLVATTSIGFAAKSPRVRVYEVTITNLTGGQPLTPPLIATHRRPIHVFSVGEAASLGIQELAENGNLAPLEEALSAAKHVYAIEIGTTPLVPAGVPGSAMFDDAASYTIESARGAKYLSFASMLICTNDGFAGLDAVRLPRHLGRTMTVYGKAYDAGTEINTEDFADIVPPCQELIGVSSGDPGTGMSNPALAEGGVIHPHLGVLGGSDLVLDVHNWSDPVVQVEITRVQ
jgi:hypothetical protein